MAIQTGRGTKRTCQSEDCGVRYYDLDRDPMTCPICKATFKAPPERPAPPVAKRKTIRSAFRRPLVQPAPVVAEQSDANDDIGDAPAETKGVDVADAVLADAGISQDETPDGSENTDLILELDDDDDGKVNAVEVSTPNEENA